MAETAVATPRLPLAATLLAAANLAIDVDKPIMLDYWAPSIAGTACIGIRPTKDAEGKNEMLLVRSAEEFTSTIVKLHKSQEDALVVVTENSIYLVAMTIQQRGISAPAAAATA
jgi:hypothetical protein